MAGKFLYGVGRLQFGGKTLGYIQKGTFQLNGTKGTSTPVEAEQIPGGPVLSIPVSNGSIAPTFGIIEWDYEMMVALMGGTLVKDTSDNIIGWNAPSSELVEARGEFVIETVAKKRITIFDALVQAAPNGNLELASVAQIDTTVTPQIPVDGSAPYKIIDLTDAQWAEIMAEEAARRAAANAPANPENEV